MNEDVKKQCPIALKDYKPAGDGMYLAFNSRFGEWQIVRWDHSEQGWWSIPFDRGTTWTHWLPMPPKPSTARPPTEGKV